MFYYTHTRSYISLDVHTSWVFNPENRV